LKKGIEDAAGDIADYSAGVEHGVACGRREYRR
jgi:hypothetical protein